ncbi:MAG: leucyl aminopeptidase [Bacteroidota bacterium]
MTSLPKISTAKSVDEQVNVVYSVASDTELLQLQLSAAEMNYVKDCEKNDRKLIEINRFTHVVFIFLQQTTGNDAAGLETYRKYGAQIYSAAKHHRIKDLTISITDQQLAYAFGEGLLLSGYQFLKYRKDKKKLEYELKQVSFVSPDFGKKLINKLEVITRATFLARQWVNEPNSYLTSTVFSKLIKEKCEEAGCEVTVMDKKEIQKLNMGGLIAVNKGSIEPPTFTVIEYKPKKARNKKPVVLVGKGVVYDTGGLSLKPTPHSMDYMKSDMAGAAAVAASIYALASLESDVHVVGLIPSTDNRPGGDAYAPGDVLDMMNGLTVEVLNTDAEGRLILADALSYGDRFEPELVINTATLTGAAMRAIGTYGIVGMGTASAETFDKLKNVGEQVFERIVEFPFWSEYDEEIKSDIADLKNLGSDLGGAITAGKFLAHFTSYPFIHLDIAGPSYVHKGINYKTTGGTGVGVRLFTEFLLNY